VKGKTIILAGGSGGLGSAVAEEIARRGGLPVIGFLSNRERAEALAQRIFDKHGVRPPLVEGDILAASTRQRLLEEARNAGDLYGLVPLAGNPARMPVESATEEDLVNSMRVNFVGPVLLARDFAAAARERDASIVFVSTMQAIGIFPGSTVYAAPKAALVHSEDSGKAMEGSCECRGTGCEQCGHGGAKCP